MTQYKIFCENHIATKENPKGTDCSAYLAEARVFKCRRSFSDIKIKKYNGILHIYIQTKKFQNKHCDGICRNFEMEEGLLKKIKEEHHYTGEVKFYEPSFGK